MKHTLECSLFILRKYDVYVYKNCDNAKVSCFASSSYISLKIGCWDVLLSVRECEVKFFDSITILQMMFASLLFTFHTSIVTL